ncbi:hypothetical protein SAMN05877753_104264 [Bacillus oleivorans]|uniref:Uncharacterized protein n=1 Tax=Bacillus oleivorans TaxID=1448271 RepID=A0A285CT05_9BACI|nr:hypothetical protein [Bacillus oleivorans]SNX70697.1 hypothetical protein SAMN05877753_104264 [Bacillus oleivorans]
MNFNFKNSYLSAKLIFLATCAAVISLFLPWADLGFISASGFQQQGYLLLIFFIYPIYRVLTGKSLNKVAGLICGIIAVIGTFLFLSTKSVDVFGTTVNGAGSGLYLFLIASIVLTVGVLLEKPKQTV